MSAPRVTVRGVPGTRVRREAPVPLSGTNSHPRQECEGNRSWPEQLGATTQHTRGIRFGCRVRAWQYGGLSQVLRPGTAHHRGNRAIAPGRLRPPTGDRELLTPADRRLAIARRFVGPVMELLRSVRLQSRSEPAGEGYLSERRVAAHLTSQTLSEFDSKRLLSGVGVPVVAETSVDDPAEAAVAAETLGFPVAVKLCGAGLAHKTERGVVRLGVETAQDVRTAALDLLAEARRQDGEVSILVSRMLSGKRELIAGMARDATFGPCVMLGVGGIFAEAVADVVFRMAPLTRADALDAISDLRTQRLLGEFRGEPPVDRDTLAAILCRIGDLALDRPDVVSVDVNPLIVVDGTPVAADALVEVEVP